MTPEQRKQHLQNLKDSAFRKYLFSSDVPRIPRLAAYTREHFGSSCATLKFDPKTGLNIYNHSMDYIRAEHRKDAERVLRVLQNINMGLEKKAEEISVSIVSYRNMKGTSEDRIYFIDYAINPPTQGTKGRIVMSMSRECDMDAAAAVAFLNRIGVENVFFSPSEPGYSSNTARKPSRKELEKQNEELRNLSAELEGKLQNAQGELQNAQEKLQKAQEERGRLTSELAYKDSKLRVLEEVINTLNCKIKNAVLKLMDASFGGRNKAIKAAMEILEGTQNKIEGQKDL